MAKLIKNWEELFQVPPNNKYKIIPDKSGYACGWIVPINETSETEEHYFKHHVYLSSHTFYGSSYKYYTKKLQEHGFDVEIDNWDKKGKEE